MKLSLQLKLGQQLTMTPQLQQAIRLLQLSTLDLQQEIHQALESNPMLELVEDGDTDTDLVDYSDGEGTSGEAPLATSEERPTSTESEYDSAATESDYGADESTWENDIPEDLAVDSNWDDIYTNSYAGEGNPDADTSDFESRNSVTETLQDHLLWQLNLTPMSDSDREIAMAIIDAIDSNGMLATDIEAIHAGLAETLEVDLEEVTAVLHRVQRFDPVGVGYRNLAECLTVQLSQFDAPEQTELVRDARVIINEHLALLANRDYPQILRRTRMDEARLRDAVALIESLNPRPGADIAPPSTTYIIPDVIVTKQPGTGKWRVELNPDVAPRIRINAGYAALVKRADTSSDNTFLRDNLQEARWFLKSLQSRNETLMKVASRIVEHQQGFLEYGEEAMKPLVLHDIAEAVSMHESTISRVTTQKYMHTPRGIFELKYFFSSHVSTAAGGECSSTAIRAIIKKLVAAENARKPLSDSKITQLLEAQGINVARRTIAKYRESLSIPPSNERKRMD